MTRSTGVRLALAVAAIAVGLLATAVSGGATIRAAVYPAGAELGVTMQPSPDQVTAGYDVAFVVTVLNRGADPGRNVVLTDTLGPGEGLVDAIPTQGSCSHAGGTVTCALGEMPSAGRASVRVIVTTRSSPAILSNTAKVTNTTHDPNKANNTRTGYVQASAPNGYSAAGYIPPSGGSVETGAKATKANPAATAVKGGHTANGFSMSIYQYTTTNSGYGCGDGFRCFGPIVDLYSRDNALTAAHPATVSLRVDASQIPAGKTIDRTRVFDNGAIVPHCFASATGAQPNPCVASRSVLGDGDWKFVIRTANRYSELRL